MTEWQAIPWFPSYQASLDGQIRRATKRADGSPIGFIRKPRIVRRYSRLSMSENGIKTHHFVHKLIALTFIGQRPLGMQIRHIDGNRMNNAANNLCYGTAKENCHDRETHGNTQRGERHKNTKLTELNVRNMRRLSALGLSYADIARGYEITREGVRSICLRINWGHIA